MPSDVLEAVLAFLTGFDTFTLSHASPECLSWLSDPEFWQERLHGQSAADAQGPPWMKDLKGSARRLRFRMKGIVQRDLEQHWKRKYMLERSVYFRGMGSQDFIYRRQRGPYAFTWSTMCPPSRDSRDPWRIWLGTLVSASTCDSACCRTRGRRGLQLRATMGAESSTGWTVTTWETIGGSRWWSTPSAISTARCSKGKRW